MTSVSRLIDTFVPEHYDLSLSFDRPGRKFEGTVTITGSSTGDNLPIVLHSKDLTIQKAAIDDIDAAVTHNENDELFLTVDKLPAGAHKIIVVFSGVITDQMHGLYPCYFEHDGVKKELLATQFESHHAREVFPCIDEPAAKATFSLQLLTELGQTVLSNMPIKTQATDNSKLITDFDTTPRMSTYLLAFVIGELQRKTATTKSGVEVNIWSTPAQPMDSLDFALDIATRAIEFYDDYFGTPYPLPKSDHVALPDFTVGAMENWGLITYRETALLADPKITSIESRHHIAIVIVHELAHQWFGNLVTMAWWNDLWLNESFATLMEYIAVDALHPEWNIWLDFSTGETIMALRRDSIDGVQAVQVDVNHPDEISTLFDGAIVYAKGARLLRMIQQYIGHDAFRDGLKRYFADYAYKNTVGNDLWEALSAASGKHVADIMNVWISQSGLPVVTITRDDEHITLSQKQFFVGPHSSSDKLWPIPLDSSDNGAPQLFDGSKITYPSKTPIRLNRTDSAHFVTNYDSLSRQTLIDSVANGSLDTIGRVQLLDESTLLTRGGIMPSDQLLPLLYAYKNETLEPVWDMISLGLGELRKFIEDNPESEQKLRSFSAKLAQKQYERLGWEPHTDEPEEDTKLRSIIISLTLYGQNPDALAKAKDLYDNNSLENLDPELRPLIISSVARYGDGKIVDDMLKIYRKTHSAELKEDICIGITSTRVADKIALLLETIKDTKTIRTQDTYRWFIYLIRGRESREMTWRWVRDNWDWVESTFGGDKSYDDFPRYAASALVTRQELEEYKTFFEPKKSVPALKRVIAMGISEIEGRVELIERDKSAVVQALLSLK
ncbi:MAG: putative Aminopeptidase [Candidatus Saccharibacteria bacterium]|nr:putative Aminopeptidase [Candidatus Saccharibacteria bacterium]